MIYLCIILDYWCYMRLHIIYVILLDYETLRYLIFYRYKYIYIVYTLSDNGSVILLYTR